MEQVAVVTPQAQEAKLSERLRAGDPAAMEEVYHAYKDRLYSFVARQLNGDYSAAEDIVQETFLGTLTSLDKFRGDSQLYTWLRSIASHKISDFYRGRAQEARLEKLDLDADAIDPRRISSDELMAPSTMESAERDHVVHQALVDLPWGYRQVLALKYFEGMSVLEISQIMARSPKSVEGLLSRARKALRISLVRTAKSD
jgi:RNA polymerase sigma-70 factor (ECF subfamily)